MQQELWRRAAEWTLVKGRIVIGSADTDFFLLFAHILEAAGYRTSLSTTDADVSSSATDAEVRAVLLDHQAGGFSAVNACRSIKENAASRDVPTVAIIAAQARAFAPARLLDYLHRRLSYRKELFRQGGRLQHSGIVVDLDERTVTQHGMVIHLAPIEFALLACLMARPTRVCSRTELLDAAWPGRRFVESATLNVHIGRLRKALTRDGECVIRTVRSIGYAFGFDCGAAGACGPAQATEADHP
jgi:two-component system phosphate regulon response regulator PhoB